MLSVIHINETSQQASPATYEIQEDDNELFINYNQKRTVISYDAYQRIPEIINFTDADGNDTMQMGIDANYTQIKQDVIRIVKEELERIENDPELRKLLKKDTD